MNIEEKFMMLRGEDDGCNPQGKDEFGMKIKIEWEFADYIDTMFDLYYKDIRKFFLLRHDANLNEYSEAIRVLLAMKQALLLQTPKKIPEFRKRIEEDLDIAYLQDVDRETFIVMYNPCRNMKETIRRLKYAFEGLHTYLQLWKKENSPLDRYQSPEDKAKITKTQTKKAKKMVK